MGRSGDVPEIVDRALPFSPDRDFTTYALVPTHRQLLLRSPMGERWPERIDLVFKGVSSMKVDIFVPGLAVRKAAPGQQTAMRRAAAETVYLLTGDNGFSGYVVAAALWMAVDRQHAGNPSPLLFDIEGTPAPDRLFRLE